MEDKVQVEGEACGRVPKESGDIRVKKLFTYSILPLRCQSELPVTVWMDEAN